MAGPVPTVLIVEDEALILLALEDIAITCGYAVFSFGDHAAAMAALDGSVVDFAILDGKSGGQIEFTLARSLRQRGIPFAFCTGVAKEEFPEDLRDVPFISKPFSDEDVVVVLPRAHRD